MRRVLALLLLLIVPTVSHADESLTRRDGFLMIWESIKRPAEPAKTAFSDVPDLPNNGSLEIDYAKSRGIIGDEHMFRPNESLTLETALIWMIRTRNITDDPADVKPDTLPDLLARYPIAHYAEETSQQGITTDELHRLIELLDKRLKEEDHEVSLYSEKFHGKGTAFGEKFNMHALTAAHRSFPSNTLVKVTNIDNGKSVIVRINDRGPFVKGRDMDLSLGAFTSIAERSKGKIRATFERLGDFRLVENGHELATATIDNASASSFGSATSLTVVQQVPAVPTIPCDNNPAMQRRIGSGIALKNGVPTSFALGSTLTLDAPKHFVVRGVTYPDGTKNGMQDYVLVGESFSFKPSIEGTYTFNIGAIGSNTSKRLKMEVVACK